MSFKLVEWTEEEFKKFQKDKLSGIIEFGASWCGACKLTEPAVAEASVKYPDLSFAKIDVSKNPGLASRMGVMSLPNIFVFSKGKVASQIIGATNAKTLEDKIKKII